jgi:hypothetical protein
MGLVVDLSIKTSYVGILVLQTSYESKAVEYNLSIE